jgi:two-component system NtrC family sensor kinase
MAAVGQLAGGIAHEINNPLGAILAFAQLGLRDVDPTSETFEFLKEIEEGALRCKDIVQNLLTFSRSSRAEEVSEVDLNSVVDRACVLLGHEFHVGRWQLETRCRTGLPLVRGNRNRLQQVAVNLLTNAKAAMPNGGRVVVATEVDEQGRVVLSVTDEGTGIPEHILPKIFEPFFTTKEEGKGTGLGLAVSYGIVKEHEGAIEVETEEGQGATFRVLLPAATAARGRGRSGGRRR